MDDDRGRMPPDTPGPPPGGTEPPATPTVEPPSSPGPPAYGWGPGTRPADPAPTGQPETPDSPIGHAPPPPPPAYHWQVPTATEPPWRARHVLGRSLDTFWADLPRMLALALPGAIVSGAILLVPVLDLAAVVAIVVIGALLSAVAGIAIAVLTDALWRGGDLSFGDLLRASFRRLLPLVGTYLLVGLAATALVLGIAALTVAEPVVGALVILLALIPFTIVILRLTPLVPVVLFDNVALIPAVRRSWQLTRGHVWRLFRLGLLMGLVSMPPLLGGQWLAAATDIPAVAVLGAIVSGLMTAPLAGISSTLAWGAMAGREHSDNTLVRTGHGRKPAFAALLGFGLILAVAAAVEGDRTGRSFAGGGSFAPFGGVTEPGVIIAGTSQNPLDPCRPSNPKSQFATGEPIHIGGYFTRAVPPGGSADAEVWIDGLLVETVRLGSEPLGYTCYYEREPLVHDVPSDWRIVIRESGQVIAEGSFSVR